jgi:ubiquinone/menaquinone biosynthesis C-methylase UbiE
VAVIHALEHAPNSRQMVREIYRILKDDGVLIVVVPHFAGWSSEKNGASRKWLQPENHYSHFALQAIARVV